MRVINLFSGCGGCSLGLIQAGFEVRLAADIDEEACETYAANLGKEVIWPVDLSNVGPDELLERSQLDLGKVRFDSWWSTLPGFQFSWCKGLGRS